MSLKPYHIKRNFKESPEPPGKQLHKNEGPPIFVVQRHKASRLHYDFRLEHNGKLKSWAVPKGPSMNPADKRLAMMVEDHPYEYKDFKGVIPSGYGAGIVEIWDKGYYMPLDEDLQPAKSLAAGLKNGHVKILLKGKKLKGIFALIELKSAENAWLLIKDSDEYAVDKPYNPEEYTPKNSPINKALQKTSSTKKRS